MNNIKKIPLEQLGLNFIDPAYLPAGKDEYYLRNLQNRNGITYRQLTAFEIEVLVRNGNTCDNWYNFFVSDFFNPELVKNCKFYGLVRIGRLEPLFLEHSRLRVPVGLYNSTIISCDFGDNVSIDHVNYLSYYIIGSEVIIANVNELMTTPYAKFGNGVVKEGEAEESRIKLEICNENGGRSVIPFNGMLAGDAWIWSKFRERTELLNRLLQFTEDKFDVKRGYYGKIGDRTVVKNSRIIKDVWIGSDAYIKGANKLKNLSIESSVDAQTQIGEGCELVNGLIGLGCRIFYGSKAVRFIMASHSQLKYGARLINSYLGNNATISCCEVLNSLIFPFHEQHHNNSFLCAAVIMGQSNMAAGATIGSNHNSRSPDGELVANRGFWPGLCVSVKHNCRFASFTMMAKGDYPYELDIQLPFSLVSMPHALDELHIAPAYWFRYNLYALARNSWKYEDRDKRIDKTQHIEIDYLAPDTIQEMQASILLLERWVGQAWYRHQNKEATDGQFAKKGKTLLEQADPLLQTLKVTGERLENARRPVVILKPLQAWQSYRQMVRFYGLRALVQAVATYGSLQKAKNWFAKSQEPLQSFVNVGGQLLTEKQLNQLLLKIEQHKIKGWDQVHEYYQQASIEYENKKMLHGILHYQKEVGIKFTAFTKLHFAEVIQEYLNIRSFMVQEIEKSRAKDYSNPFRNMMYANPEERDKVLGALKDNAFINLEKNKLAEEKRFWKHFFDA